MAKPFDLQNQEWWKVPRVGNSHLSDVYAAPSPGGFGPQWVMDSWSGGVIDTTRHDLLVCGGGHVAYAGDEVYAFNVDTLLWRVKNYYSAPGTGDTESAAGGGPASRQTYSILAYDPGRDRMVMGAGGVLYGSLGNFTFGCWEMDCSVESPSSFNGSAWTQLDTMPALPTGQIRSNLVFRPGTTKCYYQGTGLQEIDPTLTAGSQWTDQTSFESDITTNAVTVVPGSPNRLIMVGGGTGDGTDGTTVRELVSPWNFEGGGQNAYGTTGDTIIESVGGASGGTPGIGYDSNTGKVVCWAGTLTGGADNRDSYELDLTTKIWTRKAGIGDVPDAPTGNGVFGRFASLGGCGAAYAGLFVLVNSTTSDVFFFRASGASTGFPPLPGPTILNDRLNTLLRM